MSWRKECLDVIFVPIGLSIMCGYHLFLLYRGLKFPQTTAFGYEKIENHCRKVWVKRMLQIETKERGVSLTVISTTTSAATFLASTSLVLSSLIGAWIGSSSDGVFTANFIYGDTSISMIAVKYTSLLSCFLDLPPMCEEFSPRHFPHEHAKQKCSSGLCSKGSHKSKYLLVSWFMGDLLHNQSAAMDFQSDTHVHIPSYYGGDLHNLDTNSTPLPQFQPKKNLSLLSKMGNDVSAVMRIAEDRENVQGAKGPGSASTGLKFR